MKHSNQASAHDIFSWVQFEQKTNSRTQPDGKYLPEMNTLAIQKNSFPTTYNSLPSKPETPLKIESDEETPQLHTTILCTTTSLHTSYIVMKKNCIAVILLINNNYQLCHVNSLLYYSFSYSGCVQTNPES